MRHDWLFARNASFSYYFRPRWRFRDYGQYTVTRPAALAETESAATASTCTAVMWRLLSINGIVLLFPQQKKEAKYPNFQSGSRPQSWIWSVVGIRGDTPYRISTKWGNARLSYWRLNQFPRPLFIGLYSYTLFSGLRRTNCTDSHRPVIGALNTCLRFQMCCFVSKAERVKGDGLTIEAKFRPLLKGGLGENVSELNKFNVRPTNSWLYFCRSTAARAEK